MAEKSIMMPKRDLRSVRRQIAYVAIATACLLTIPLFARFPWSPGDFVGMGILLFTTGLTYVLISRLSDSAAYRAAVAIGVVAGLLLIWLNLAVGLIGSEDNPANSLYVGVFIVGLIGATIARFQPKGMARALFAMALAQFLVPVIALIVWRPDFSPGVVGVFMLNGVFVALFTVSALLFRQASFTDATPN